MKTKTEYRRRKGICGYEIINDKQWSRIAKDHRHFIMLHAYLKEPSKSNVVKYLTKRPYIKYVLKYHREDTILSIRLLKLSCHDGFKNMDCMNKKIITSSLYGATTSNIYNFDI